MKLLIAFAIIVFAVALYIGLAQQADTGQLLIVDEPDCVPESLNQGGPSDC